MCKTVIALLAVASVGLAAPTMALARGGGGGGGGHGGGGMGGVFGGGHGGFGGGGSTVVASSPVSGLLPSKKPAVPRTTKMPPIATSAFPSHRFD
jgi:hypothetical protein